MTTYGVPTVGGYPDYTQSGDMRIPQLFSRVYQDKLYDETIVANITNTDNIGELKSLGDTVIINTIPDVTIGTYYKGKQRSWELCKSDPVIMRVQRASDFAVVQDDVDKKQFWDKDFLGTLAKDAMKKVKIKIDTDFLGSVYADADSSNIGAAAGAKTGFYDLGTTGAPVGITKTNVTDYIMNVLECVADEQSWPDDERWLAVPTWMKGLMNVSDYKDESITGMDSTYKGGRFGKVGKFKMYQTNLYTAIADNSGKTAFPVLFGTKKAIAFVSQLSNTQFFPQLEATSGSGLAGINLYDWKVIAPKQLGYLYCYKAQ